ncbi:hypothetical protein K493DRAFT_387094 [Basidiobolus meristosporus CBS 931.73]|uniref:RGS domain-containing protein n=1 Tax=Basidiobolus meristosporus CBS 931.73 TaxID=1314790 RepID=A0A1Y1ZBN5_9FUNG|nr:hypothetical protein K493DRAFT_387094 [Basidiobolus meristosporus CBS 931.73]|eukprot:ORY07723.1 hypothetical protein K493DRAFT_387094 [Basidiobolus meristosporus CBS 931.73]
MQQFSAASPNLRCHRYSYFPSVEHDIPRLKQFTRQPRRSEIQAARNQRTFEHIESYIKVIVFVTSQRYFPVTIARSSTVEELARLIEAEYAFNYSNSPQLTNSLDYVKESNQSLKQLLEKDLMEDLTESELLGFDPSLEEDNENNTKPLVCGAIFFGRVELDFTDRVGDILSLNDFVRVVNIYEDHSSLGELDDGNFAGEVRRWSCPFGSTQSPGNHLDEQSAFPSLPRHHSTKKTDMCKANGVLVPSRMRSTDPKMHNIFQNKMGLNYLREFCLKMNALENFLFWVEVEVYRCTKSSLVSVIADYLYKVYIAQDGPLRINIPEEIRKAIPQPTSFPQHVPNINIFDEAQEHVFDMLAQCVVPQFEVSELYARLLQERASEPTKFEEAYIGECVTRWLQFDINTVANVMEVIHRYHGAKIDMKDVPEERESILHQIMNQMFPPLDPHPYFTSKYASLDHTSKKLLLKKKLAKILGRRSFEKEVIQRMIDESVFSPGSLPPTFTENPQNINTIVNSDKEMLKKKKIEKLEKLEGFFGKKLSTTELAHQNLLGSSENLEVSNCFEPEKTISLCPMVTYNDLSPEERRLLTKRTRKLNLLFGEPMDEQLVSKSLTNPTIAHKLTEKQADSSISYYESPIEEIKDHSVERSNISRNSKEIKRKKLVKLYQLLGVYPSSNEIENGSIGTDSRREALIQRNARPMPPEIRKLQLKKANKLEKVFGHHPPKEYLTVNKDMELSYQCRSSILSHILDSESSVEDMMLYLEVLSDMNDESTDGSDSYSMYNFNEREPFEGTSDTLEVDKATRQRKLTKLRRFFGNDLGLDSLITQNIFLRHHFAVENVYDASENSELFGQYLNACNFDPADMSEEIVRDAMKKDLEQLRREVQELHRISPHNCSQHSFIKRLARKTSISRSTTFRSLRSMPSSDSRNSLTQSA